MKDFLSDLVAVALGIMLAFTLLAYATADPKVKTYCEASTTNPIDKFGCTVRLTVNP